MNCKDCIDWGDTSVQKYSKFIDAVKRIAPNFSEWANQSSNRSYEADSSIDQETYMLYFMAEKTESMAPDRYMKFKTINSNEKRLDSSYYHHLLYNISLDLEILEEVGML